MVGFMNEEAFRKTVETGNAVFYSRSRNKLWLKGETSGHKLVVKEISTDCDLDTVLVKVEALGPESVTKATRAASSAAWKTEPGKSPTSAPTIPTRCTEADVKLKLGIPKAASKTRPSIFPPRRLPDHRQQPLVFPRDRRS